MCNHSAVKMIYKVFCIAKYSLILFFRKVYIFFNTLNRVIKSRENSIGAWAFLIGVILAVAIGISTMFIPISSLTKYSSFIYLILVVLGIIIGISINATGKDSQTFLITAAILVIVSRFGMDSVIGSLIGIGAGDIVSSIFASLLALFVPATVIVALKSVFGIAKV
jgi:hypothetical protein